jgi:hypothetical protein
VTAATSHTAIGVSLVCLILLAACAERPRVLNIPVAAVHTSKDLVTDQDVKEAIRRASLATGWSLKDDAPGRLTASRTEGDQTAIVTIGYQMSMYSIRYKDSDNLKYRRKPVTDMAGGTHDADYATIDQKYNDWVASLDQAIQRELSAMR